MRYRRLGKTGFQVSEISLGTWQVGGVWGSGFDDANAERILEDAIDRGVNFIDTADVYGDGRSERIIASFLKERAGERIYVATKMGRRVEQKLENYTPEAFVAWTQRSRDNLATETLDLVQLHCPPFDVYYTPELFAGMDGLKQKGKILHYGVSVEKVEQAQKAMEYPGVASVQIIFNMVRQRPAERFLDEALSNDVGVLARVPLASGLLTGKYQDGIPPGSRGEVGGYEFLHKELTDPDRLARVAALKPLADRMGASLAQFSLAWCLQNRHVSTVITGASRVEQIRENMRALEFVDAFTPELMDEIDRICA